MAHRFFGVPVRAATRRSVSRRIVPASLSALLFPLAALAVATPASAAGRDPSWWPGGATPPFVVLDPAHQDHPRAVLLAAGSFRTDSGAPREVGARIAGALPASLRGAPLEARGWAIVQFAPEVDARARLEILAAHGATPGGFIPRNALLAHLQPGVAAALEAQPGVLWIGRFHPAFKLAPALGLTPELTTSVDPTAAAWTLDLRPAPGFALDDVVAAAQAAGAQVVDAAPHLVRATVDDASALVALAQRDEVLYIEDAPEAKLFNDQSRGICQSGSPGNDSVHVKGIRGTNQTVAIMDSGIDTRHCCFDGAGKIIDNRAWGGGVLGALCNGDHGTHVSGTVGCDNAGNHDGLAPLAKLILQDIQKGDTFACSFGSVSPPSTLSPAWSDARSRGARVHTNSWGGGGNSYGSSTREIDEFMWNNQDFLILFAAGNSGSGSRTLGSYSNAKNSVTVGGVVNGSGLEDMYGGSSRGPAGDGRMLPDLTAPAQGVSSALNNKTSASCGWTTYTGTSMATPAVAGSAALVREYFERGFYPTGAAAATNAFQPSAALVKAVLLASARNMTGSGTRGARPNADQGFGRLTLDDALWFSADGPAQRLEILDDRNSTTGFSTAGVEQTFTFGTKGPGAVKLMLVWTDAPGTPGAATALVNDLDLVVTTADGQSYAGNAGFVDGWTATPSDVADRLNNKEAVFLASAPPGPVTVKVRANSLGDVAAHPQDFSLIALATLDPSCTAPAAPSPGTVTHRRVGSNLRASWPGTGASSYTVYRGTSPTFMRTNPAAYRAGVQDEDAGTPGVQWTDTDAASGATSYYYFYYGANSCGELAP